MISNNALAVVIVCFLSSNVSTSADKYCEIDRDFAASKYDFTASNHTFVALLNFGHYRRRQCETIAIVDIYERPASRMFCGFYFVLTLQSKEHMQSHLKCLEALRTMVASGETGGAWCTCPVENNYRICAVEKAKNIKPPVVYNFFTKNSAHRSLFIFSLEEMILYSLLLHSFKTNSFLLG